MSTCAARPWTRYPYSISPTRSTRFRRHLLTLLSSDICKHRASMLCELADLDCDVFRIGEELRNDLFERFRLMGRNDQLDTASQMSQSLDENPDMTRIKRLCRIVEQ